MSQLRDTESIDVFCPTGCSLGDVIKAVRALVLAGGARRAHSRLLGRRVLCMDAEDLRSRLTELLGFAVPPVRDLLVRAEQERDGYVELTVTYTGDEGDVPALLLVPEHPCGAGVVVHHQHHAQWQFGKSEAPMLGSQTQPTTSRRCATGSCGDGR